MRRAMVLITIGAALLSGCEDGGGDPPGSSPPSSSTSTTTSTTTTTTTTVQEEEPVDRAVFTEEDDGRRVVFDERTVAELRLREDGGWETPQVVGSSIELVPVSSVSSTGSYIWELAVRGDGQTTITVPSPTTDRTFTLTITVVR